MGKQSYEQNFSIKKGDPRANLILQKARYYRVAPLSNEYLLGELFMLKNDETISGEQLEVFYEFTQACQHSVQEAQMSK